MVGASQNHQGLFAHFGHLPSPHIEAPETPSFLIGDEGVGCGVGCRPGNQGRGRHQRWRLHLHYGCKTLQQSLPSQKSSGQKTCSTINPFNCEECVFFFVRSNITYYGARSRKYPLIWSAFSCDFFLFGGTPIRMPGYKPRKLRLLHQVHMLQTQPAIRIRPRPLFEVPPADTERWKMEVLRMETRLIPTRYTCYVLTIHLSNLIYLCSEFPKESLHNIYSISHEVFIDQITPCHRTSHLHPINGSAARYGRRCCRVALQVLLGQRRTAGVARHFRGAVEVQDAAAGQKPKQLLEEWSFCSRVIPGTPNMEVGLGNSMVVSRGPIYWGSLKIRLI